MTKRRSPAEIQHLQRTQSGSKLSPEDVARIKWLQSKGLESDRSLAAVYDVSLWTIRAIRRGDIWRWVEPDNGPGEAAALSSEVKRDASESLDKLLAMIDQKKAPDRALNQFINPAAKRRYLGETQGVSGDSHDSNPPSDLDQPADHSEAQKAPSQSIPGEAGVDLHHESGGRESPNQIHNRAKAQPDQDPNGETGSGAE